MFSRREEQPRGSFLSPFIALFRLVLSVIIIGILLFGAYQAFRSFSGFDPVNASPKAIVKSLLSSENLVNFMTSLLSLDPQQSIKKAEDILSNGGKMNKNTTLFTPIEKPKILNFKFALVSDSHNDNQNLAKALNQAKHEGASFVIGLGDYTDVGTIDELKQAKLEFDKANLSYYVTAGDHDLWDSRNKGLPAQSNFNQVFASPYQSFGFKDVRFIIVYNSDNYFGVDSFETSWLEDELTRANSEHPKLIFVMAGIPLFHPSSDHIMGKVEPKLKEQASKLASLFKQNKVDEVFAADTHFYSRYKEPVNDLQMTSIGAVTSARNIQTPRFAIVDVFEDGSYNVWDVEIK